VLELFQSIEFVVGWQVVVFKTNFFLVAFGSELGVAPIDGDAIHPRTEFALSFELAEFFVHFHEHILRQFFSQHGVFAHLQGERVHHVFVLIHQNGKCMTVARQDFRYEFLFVQGIKYIES
jgi:hypothetical protein